MGKQEGWMDQDHGPSRTMAEAIAVDLMRSMNDEQRNSVLTIMQQLVAASAPPGGPDTPPINRPTKPTRPH